MFTEVKFAQCLVMASTDAVPSFWDGMAVRADIDERPPDRYHVVNPMI